MTEKSSTSVIGKPIDRVDGRLKVTGAAKYAAEWPTENLAYAVVIQSTIPRGRVREFDTAVARQVSGVIEIFHYKNQPAKLPAKVREKFNNLSLLQDDQVRYAGQIVGVAIAETLESAVYAASLVKVTYDREAFTTDFSAKSSQQERADESGEGEGEGSDEEDSDYERGNVETGLRTAAVKMQATYTTPMETHNPMEPFAVIASWEGEKLTVWDTTQAIFQTRSKLSEMLSTAEDNIRIVSKFVGGGFGSKLTAWSHVPLAALCAKKTKRPVKLVLNRHQMFGPVGCRPSTMQEITLGATSDGTLTAIIHHGVNETCTFKEYTETVTHLSQQLYKCPNVRTTNRLVKLDIGEPTWMRAPGHATGSYALECAMDELACALEMDPIELRVRNYSDVDCSSGLPWSGNTVRECYRQGAERFGWHKRNSKPGNMIDGRYLVGYGMATAMHSVWRNEASASIKLFADGTALVQTGSQDIGTGTYTIMSQIAAEGLTLPLDKVRFELGDSELPKSPMSGGSTTAGSVGNAVALTCQKALKRLIEIAVKDPKSPLHGADEKSVVAQDGTLIVKGSASKADSFIHIIERTKNKCIEARVDTKLDDNEEKYSMSTFGAQFVEVRVDRDLGLVSVSRFLGAYGAGRILNPKTARSQILGGMIFGMGMALTEATLFDHQLGRIVNADFAEYHVPVHADLTSLEPFFVEENDPYVNAVGAKGVGELGITGAAAAIANAVYNATGKRIRDLPITLDKLL